MSNFIELSNNRFLNLDWVLKADFFYNGTNGESVNIFFAIRNDEECKSDHLGLDGFVMEEVFSGADRDRLYDYFHSERH